MTTALSLSNILTSMLKRSSSVIMIHEIIYAPIATNYSLCTPFRYHGGLQIHGAATWGSNLSGKTIFCYWRRLLVRVQIGEPIRTSASACGCEGDLGKDKLRLAEKLNFIDLGKRKRERGCVFRPPEYFGARQVLP